MPEREKVISALEQCISTDKTCTGCPYEGTVCTTTLNSDALALLKEHPQIIRCKDCKYYNSLMGYCKDGRSYPSPDWFCADGERKVD